MDTGTDTSTDDVNTSALAALMQEPEVEDSTEEEAALDADGGEIDGPETDTEELDTSDHDDGDDFLEIDEDDFQTKYKYNDEEFTLQELIEARNNAAVSEIIEQERAELDSLRQQLDEQQKGYEYLQYEKVPHKFLTGALRKMVEGGSLPEQAYIGVVDLFNNLIEQGLYDPKKVEQVFESERERQAIENERKAVESEREQARIEREIAEVQATYGALTPAISEKLLGYMRSQAQRGNQMTLIEAAKANEKLFATPPTSKRKLADRHRTKQPAKPRSVSMTSGDALKAFYQ